uniref:Uncharacterized protein n=1 Tax=Romanomermis culicivorax TaxID=13658 RepID=A0A915JTF1_ROMCU
MCLAKLRPLLRSFPNEWSVLVNQLCYHTTPLLLAATGCPMLRSPVLKAFEAGAVPPLANDGGFIVLGL